MRASALQPRDRLIVALDIAELREAEALAERLDGAVGVYKIGLELALAGGLGLAERLARQGRAVFLDMKLLDIDNTVARAVERAADLGMAFLTVHAYPHAMAAAAGARGDSALRLLAVTVLTSLDDADLAAAGYANGVEDLVERRARQAAEIGFDGVVASPREAALVRAAAPDLAIVTPGVRPAGNEAGDQKRTLTPAEAIAAGADYLVIGRPITRAADPRAAAEAIVAEIGGVVAGA